MKLKNLLNKWNLTKLKVNAEFLQVEIEFKDADRDAAWELYVELLTRITTQHLEPDHGDEETALNSIFSLFKTTRDILKRHGAKCVNFSKIAIIVLNQVVRPFTAKWHKKKLAGAFSLETECEAFRNELSALQAELRNYTRLLSDIAGVEDLTSLEKE